MEGTGGGIFGRLLEKTLGWIVLGVLVALGFAIYQMDPATRAALWAGIWKTGVWVALAAALPWSARLFIRRILAIRSNWAAVALLAAFTLIDAAIGLILLNGLPGGAWSWVAALAALGVVGTYNFLVAEYLAEEFGV